MSTPQNQNSLTIHNLDFDRQAAKICFAGRVGLTTEEIAAVLQWLREGPISDHVIISFSDREGRELVATGDKVAFGELDRIVAKEDALTYVNHAKVRSTDKQFPFDRRKP